MKKTSLFAQKFTTIHKMTHNITEVQPMNLDITENLATSLELECTRAGTNFTEICKDAGVHRSTVQRWKDQEPKTFLEIRKIMQAIHARRQKASK